MIIIVNYNDSNYSALLESCQFFIITMVMVMDGYFNVGKRILEWRTKCGLSQEQVALQADITPTYLGQIERNVKNPTIRIVERICLAMNVSLADFFCVASEPKEIDTLSLQIVAQVANRSEEEKRIVLNILKQILQLRDFEK